MSATTPAAIQCDKCKQSAMLPARVPRTSPGLRMLGFLLWVPAMLLMLTVGGCGLLMTGAGVSTTDQVAREARNEAANRLMDIAAIPRDQVEAFQKTGRIETAHLRLSPQDSDRADTILSSYHASIAGAALGGSMATGAAGASVVATFLLCAPFLIVGLLLTLNKNVWRCPTCGYVFERA